MSGVYLKNDYIQRSVLLFEFSVKFKKKRASLYLLSITKNILLVEYRISTWH